MERATSSEHQKGRLVQFNERVYSVGGLQWRPVTNRACQHQQQVDKMATSGQHVAKSLQLSGGGTSSDEGRVVSFSQPSAVTSVSASWSHDQARQTAVVTRGHCEAASVHQVASTTVRQSNDDKVEFEDGLTHLRQLYETQLNSFRSDLCAHFFHLMVHVIRGATMFSKLGVQFLDVRYYYPSTEKNRQIYPVWCSRLLSHTLLIKQLC